jgi:putative hydrolase of the HAD superfamily
LNREQALKFVKLLAPIPTGLPPVLDFDGRIEAILFDIYGTLFISGSGDIGIAANARCQDEKLDALLTDFSLSLSPQRLQQTLFSKIEEEHGKLRSRGVDYPEVEIDRIWMDVLDSRDVARARDFAVRYEMIVNPVYPMPHLKRMLAACRANQIRMGIISNAQFFTPYLFDWFLGDGLETLGFDVGLLYFSHEHGRAKPSPVFFFRAAEKLAQTGIAPASVLYLGNDMLNDIYPARAAGFKTALFAGDRRSLRLRKEDERCRELVPDLVITDLNQLGDVLGWTA